MERGVVGFKGGKRFFLDDEVFVVLLREFQLVTAAVGVSVGIFVGEPLFDVESELLLQLFLLRDLFGFAVNRPSKIFGVRLGFGYHLEKMPIGISDHWC